MLESKRPRRILAVGAHPDDVEILCAGTLARCKARGDEIAICIATNGNMGSMTHQPRELASIRESEAREAAAMLNAEFHWLNYPDEFIYADHSTRMKFVQMIREARPDVILTHAPNDYHQDHRAVSELVFVASFAAAVPHVETGAANHNQISPVYYMDTLAGIDFLPTDYVDITEAIETKLNMLKCHRSQLEWLGDYNGIDIVEFATTVARFRGLQSGVKFAEAFKRLDSWPRVTTVRHLP